MSFSIDDFTAQHFSRDLYRPNLFFVEINHGSYFDGDFKFLVKAATLPSSTVEALEVPFLNRVIKIAGDRTFEDWTITILNDQDFNYRESFESWLGDINNHIDNVSEAPIEYKGTLTVTPYSRDGSEATDSYEFHGAFPTTVDAMDVAWESGAAPAEYGVTFAYDYWTNAVTG